jgi:hypothetical protein
MPSSGLDVITLVRSASQPAARRIPELASVTLIAGYSEVRLSTIKEGMTSATTMSWVSSIPRLNPSSSVTRDPRLRSSLPSSAAKARPCMSPKPVAIQISPPRTIGLTACTPDTRMDNAIMLSTTRVGTLT